MTGETLLLDDRDTSTTIGALTIPLHWRPLRRYSWPELMDIATTAVHGAGAAVAIVGTTSAWINAFPQIAPISPLDLWVDFDAPFPPKHTRMAAGRVVKRERAAFKTAFSDQLMET